MRRLICLFLFFSPVLTAGHCYSQWVQQVSGVTTPMYDIYFINTETGWACGSNGVIIKTTNGGANWLAQSSGITLSLFAIHFVNQNTGYSVSLVDGNFLKTTNGGLNWFTVFSSPKTFQGLYFLDSMTGWAAGTSGTGWIFRTTNGGAVWDSVAVGTGFGKDVFFVNNQTGWCVTGSISKSSDGGLSWVQQQAPIVGEFVSISFQNINTGWAFTDSYAVYKTTNSGLNWIQQAQLNGMFQGECIFFSSINTGWASGGAGYLYKTTNGGQNWYQQNSNITAFLRAVTFLSDSIGYATGGGGRIIKTITGGAYLPVITISTEIPKEYKLHQNYPNPFNPVTNIKYQIANNNSHVKITVYDALGKVVRELVNSAHNAGTYQVSFEDGNITSGVYYYTIETEKYTRTMKMVLVK